MAVAGSHPFTAPSCRSFRQLCPSLEKPRPGFPLDVVVNASGGCLFAWFFVFCFVLFFFFFFLILQLVYIGGGRKECWKEGKKYVLSLRLWSLQSRIVGGGEVCFVGRVEGILCPSL